MKDLEEEKTKVGFAINYLIISRTMWKVLSIFVCLFFYCSRKDDYMLLHGI